MMNFGSTSSLVPNFEEAANVANEFIISLENLPNEVHHLLAEIKYREEKCLELESELNKDQTKYIKSCLKPSTPSSSSTPSSTSTPTGTTSIASKAPRISSTYEELSRLTDEKMALSKKIIELMTRTRARLDYDLTKVRMLQGENVSFSSSSVGGAGAGGVAVIEEPPVAKQEETEGSVEEPVLKKRKLTTFTSVKVASPAPSSGRSRTSRKQVEMEEEDEIDDAEEDSTLYCFCHKQSYGDMIGCDNAECPYQWFHISCVGVKQPLPDKWYCPECQKSKGSARKGRKK